MKFADKILKECRITEKAAQLSSNYNQYTFEVYREANRNEVAKAVEDFFNVTVVRVNILNKKGKVKPNRMNRGKGRTAASKRAIVSLKEGDKIELL